MRRAILINSGAGLFTSDFPYVRQLARLAARFYRGDAEALRRRGAEKNLLLVFTISSSKNFMNAGQDSFFYYDRKIVLLFEYKQSSASLRLSVSAVKRRAARRARESHRMKAQKA